MRGTAIKISNEQEYKKLMLHLEKLGYKWNACLKLPTQLNHYKESARINTIFVYLKEKVITYSHYFEADDDISVFEFIKRYPLQKKQKKPNKDLIVIYRNGDKVVAKNKVTGKIGEAKCHPNDEFDFNIGARLAFDRLMDSKDEKIEDKEQYFSGKVVCLSNVIGFTKGKIYEFVNGKTVDDDQDTRPLYDRVRDINDIYNGAFVEIVE